MLFVFIYTLKTLTLYINIEKVHLKHLEDTNALTEYSNDIEDVFANIKYKIFIVFDCLNTTH